MTALAPGPEIGVGAPRVAVESVSVRYSGHDVVGPVSFDVGPGDWVALIGPNGAGKSTLLKAIVGIVDHRGTVSVDGVASGGRGARSRRLAYVPQQPTLPPGMTTAEYVLLGRTAHLGWLATESSRDRSMVAAVLGRLDLEPMAGRYITSLSGGEAQRASLARALVQEADVLLLDEPTSALDLAHQVAVLELVDELRRSEDLAVVTAMHDLTMAGRFASEMILLSEGRVAAAGAPAAVLDPATLSRHFGTPVAVVDGPDGAIIVPTRDHPPVDRSE